MGYIYKITNIVNGKCYIGCTIDYQKRWINHKNNIKSDKWGCPALKAALKKYGVENFTFKVIIICFDSDMEFYERYYIQKYASCVPNGYNISLGGKATNGFKGKQHSDQTKNKLKMLHKHKYSDSTERAKHIEAVKRAIQENPIEHSNKIKVGMQKSVNWAKALAEKRVGNFNKRHTDTTKNKISESLKGYYSEHGPNKKCNILQHRDIMAKSVGCVVIQTDQHGNFLGEYPSIAECARSVKIPKSSVQKMLTGKIIKKL